MFEMFDVLCKSINCIIMWYFTLHSDTFQTSHTSEPSREIHATLLIADFIAIINTETQTATYLTWKAPTESVNRINRYHREQLHSPERLSFLFFFFFSRNGR